MDELKEKRLHDLTEQRNRTLAEIARLQAEARAEIEPASAGDEDLVDAAADIYERSKVLSLIHRLEEKVEQLDRAIENVERGTYGICEICGAPIPPERLAIVPETTLCVKCAQEQEAKAGIRRGVPPPRPRPVRSDESSDD
ncbi:MAG: TraR/DksA family transcriptional regulator [Anaerolineae bacterium]